MKWFFACFLVLTSFLAIPTPSFAGCVSPKTTSGGATCSGTGKLFRCVRGGSPPRVVNCCDQESECDPGTNASSETSALCGTDNKGVNTAIGCLMAGDPKLFVSQLLGWGVGVGGGIAFLLIVYAGFQMTTAAGDPKRVQAARELLVSAISGLLLIVFSIFLLNFIGIKILNLGPIGGPLP